MNCFACNNKIALGDLLRCTACKTDYHYACFNIISATFSEQKTQLIRSYICYSCSNVTRRVRVTDDTPVRGSRSEAALMEEEATKSCEENDFVGNTTSSAMNMMDSIQSVTESLKGVISARLNTIETKLLQEIKNSVATLVMENKKLREDLSAANKKCSCLEEEIRYMKKERIVTTAAQPNDTLPRDSENRPVRTPANAQSTAASTVRAAAGAPSLPAVCAPAPAAPTYAAVASKTAVTGNINDKWTVVENNKRDNNPVKKGGNTSITSLKAAERKRYLHVWRLDKSTTEDNIKEYIKEILGRLCVLASHQPQEFSALPYG
ncbi:unnamed protein product [Spodoptera exigua]|nr:unnamed protein product [Spodoptera exigua]